MAGRKLTALTSLGAKPELDDEFYLVDTSDTSESPQGTSKKITGENLAKLGGFQPVNNLQAVAAPTVTDDSSDGYSEGSMWGDGDDLYKCTDASVGAAVWVQYSKTTTNTTFTPTVSNETDGSLSVSDFMIDKVGDIVNFSFFGQFVLDGGQTSGSANIDLPTAFAPDNNWGSGTEIVGVISRTNSIFTGECFINADTGGNKLVNLEFNDTSAGATIRFTAICRYKVNN